MVNLQKNDFIEINYTALIKDTNQIFDSTNPKEAKELGANNSEKIKPVIISVGNLMTIRGLDEDLIGKEVGKEYSVEIFPEKGFGKRDSTLIKMIPLKSFTEQKVYPQKGMQFSLDGNVVKVVSVSGGRVLVDFNNPLAGKVLVYKYKILRKIEDQKEKIEALQEFFFRRKFEFFVDKEKKTLTIKSDEKFSKFVELMSKPFKEMLDLDVKVEIQKEKSDRSE